MTPLEIGSDLAGSIRIPSAFCGVYGLKTTEHRVSMYGHIPDLPNSVHRHRLLWSIGPMARSIEDLALAYSIIAGPDLNDPSIPPIPLQTTDYTLKATLNIAFATTFPGVPVQTSIKDAIINLATRLESSGHHITEQLPGIDFHELAQNRLIISRAVMDETDLPTLDEYIHALDARDHMIQTWEAFLTTYDALICPVSMTTAFPHTPTGDPIDVDGTPVNYWRAIGHCAPFNFTGHLVVTIPISLDPDGLPIGIQIVAKRWHESHLLSVASQIAQIAAFQPPTPT
jgi:amidase